jgi:hypothetical protein
VRSPAGRCLSGKPPGARSYSFRNPSFALFRAILRFSSSSWNDARAALPSALTTTSLPCRMSMRSIAALSLRLSLFLATALPTVPGMVIPTRPRGSLDGASATSTVSPSRRALDPLSRTRRKSSLLFKARTAPTMAPTAYSGGEPHAPPGPTVLQNRTARTGPHPSSESVLALAAARVGLESAFGHEPRPIG